MHPRLKARNPEHICPFSRAPYAWEPPVPQSHCPDLTWTTDTRSIPRAPRCRLPARARTQWCRFLPSSHKTVFAQTFVTDVMFRTVCVKRAARSVRIHIVRAPNTDRHIIIRAGKHPAILSANAPSSETKPPPTGRILPLADAQRPNPQSVEQSSRKPVFQRDKTPSHWRKRDANRPLSVRKTPVSGGINPLVGLSTSRFLQPVEESSR